MVVVVVVVLLAEKEPHAPTSSSSASGVHDASQAARQAARSLSARIQADAGDGFVSVGLHSARGFGQKSAPQALG